MTGAVLSLLTQFNPVIAGLLLSAGAYIALRHRVLPPLTVDVAALSAGARHGLGSARALRARYDHHRDAARRRRILPT